ncbi:DEAD/DEAH box helicase [Marinobacter alexandrii]|uniref:DEAD/DEAH box helicase n=1 Tax=Marinobacter alexandrii TaxID=2570351 RepID=UPI001107DE2E|nr:DEAD/DEAH box helicase [Marinobacter alexandrii]
MTQELRTYQSEALSQLRQGIRQGSMAQLLMAPTGSGKTTIASAIKQGACAKGKKAFFIVDSLELVDQAVKRFMDDGMWVGVIQGDHIMTNYAAPVQVATIQTLGRRWRQMPDSIRPDLLIIDEAHVLHQAHEDIISWCKDNGVPVIGLSATPFRKGLGKIFDRLVVTITTADLMDDGYLCRAKCYAPNIPNLKGVKTNSSGDWDADAVAEVMGENGLMGDVVEQWLKLAEGRQTIVFAANVAHSRALCDRFQQVGIAAAHVDGYETDKEGRTEKINAFRRGDIQVLCNVAVLTKGFDAPETACVVLARPTKSLMLHIQMIGRGLRTANEKSDCIIIDHAGNCLRNGLPDSRLPQELHDGKSTRNLDRKEREIKEPVEKPCVSCGFVSTKHVCPSCGFKPEVRQDVEVVDGDLYEITKDNAPKEKWGTEELASLYAELKGYARAKGMKDGWAFHQCREYAGRAPRNTNQIAPSAPSQKTLSIIRHLNIKNAKRRAAA